MSVLCEEQAIQRQSIWFVWSIWFISFILSLNQILAHAAK